MKGRMALLAFLLCSCQAAPGPRTGPGKAQQLVERTVAAHPGLIRLTIHAVPAGETTSRIIACNVREKIGKPSDSEDLEAMRTLKPVVLKEGSNLDVTAPILDRTGKAVAATGITLAFPSGANEEGLVKQAMAIARQLQEALQPDDLRGPVPGGN